MFHSGKTYLPRLELDAQKNVITKTKLIETEKNGTQKDDKKYVGFKCEIDMLCIHEEFFPAGHLQWQ